MKWGEATYEVEKTDWLRNKWIFVGDRMGYMSGLSH